MTDITDTELDAIDKYWAAPAAGELMGYSQTTVLRLVAALRSEQAAILKLTDDYDNALYELERERTQNRAVVATLQEAHDNGATDEEWARQGRAALDFAARAALSTQEESK